MTKIILVGDIHNHFKELDVVLEKELPFDFFISVGDVGEVSSVDQNALNIIDKWKSKGQFIKGNHDNAEFFNRLVSFQYINGIGISGINGLISKKSFLDVLKISHMINIDILVSHQAPYGMFDGMGEIILSDLLSYISPKLYIFGHIHKYKTKVHNQTFCISLPMITKGHGVAYFEGRRLETVEIELNRGNRVIKI